VPGDRPGDDDVPAGPAFDGAYVGQDLLVSGVAFQCGDQNLTEQITVKGPLGQLSLPLTGLVKIANDNGTLNFEPANESREANAMSGTVRALVNNMVSGVTKGFERKLSLVGVGYRAQAQGDKLNLSLGFSHPVIVAAPQGISFTVEGPRVHVQGIDKEQVGQVAANIRKLRPPEPYKGKGIRYLGEYVRRKAGKTGKGGKGGK